MPKKLSAPVNNIDTKTVSCDVIDRIKDILFALDTHFKFIYINKQGLEYFGRKPDEMIGKTLLEIFPDNRIQTFYKTIVSSFKKQQEISVEDFIPLLNKWFLKSIYPSSTGITVTITDITEKKIKEQKGKAILQKLQETDIKFYKTFHENPVALVLRDIKTHSIIDANQAALELFEFKSEDFIGKKLNKINLVIDEVNKKDYYESFLNEKNLHKSYRTIQTESGKKVNVLVSRSVIEIDEREVAITSFSDITNIMLAEEKVKESNKISQDFKYALDQSAIVTISNIDGNITYVNDNFCNISKYERKELLGKNHRIVNAGYHPKEFFETLWKTLEEGQIFRGDVKSKAKDGSFYWARTTIVPLLNENGKPFQYVAIRYDITEEKNAQEKLLDQLEKLKEIAWIQSHLVRAPLAKIMGLADLIRKQICTPEEEKELLNAIVDSSKELDDMIKSIVHKTKNIETFKKEV